MTRRCIYCLEEKPADEVHFNRDHVIPQAFGLFDGDNLVLHCVCRPCNASFGNTVESKLASDSLEGFDRVQMGLLPVTAFKSLGYRSTTHLRALDTGWYGHFIAKSGLEQFAFTPFTVGFARSPEDRDSEVEWYPAHQLPRREELLEKGFAPPNLYVRTRGDVDLARLDERLAAKGFGKLTIIETQPPPSGDVHVETVVRVARPEFRAITKIALNYLAAVTSPAIALMPQFNAARRFARYDEGPLIVRPGRVRSQPAPFHYVAIGMVGASIVARVSLFMRVAYTVELARGGFLVPFSVASAHQFDVHRARIVHNSSAALTVR